MRAINADESDSTKCILYYFAENEQNFLLKRRLDLLSDRVYMTVHHHVKNPSNLWRGLCGEIDAGKMIEAIGISDNTGIFVRCDANTKEEVKTVLDQLMTEKEYEQYNVKQ